MSPLAVRQLDKAGVGYVLHSYEVDDAVGAGYGEAAEAASSYPADRVSARTPAAPIEAI